MNTPMSNDSVRWYKDAVIYQLHVRAFKDNNGDGIGDFAGLTEKLDYLQDLGVTALWLLPFSPSPLRDDGYDTSDYKGIHTSYGTQRDFRRFLKEAHRRDLRVITELVVNHTSDQHPWFQRARHARPGSRERDFYVWSDDPKRYAEARIIFKDFETSNWAWDPVANAYYWHRFYSHQPDLNYDNAEVRKAISNILDFWFEMGVDGLRLDAVPYLYEREGTNCENLPETHAFLKELRRQVDTNHSNRMLLAEANQWPEDAVAYFGDGDECHMAFHFPVMPRLFMASRLEQSEALRRRALDPEAAVEQLTVHEDALEAESEGIQAMMAPEQLHGLHMEYEANLERTLRGILVVERGCAITRLPHRPPEDEEPYTYYKRGHGNVTHARMRMAEIVEVLLNWEPGKPAEATVASRLERARKT